MPHQIRDMFGPLFESVAIEHGMDIRHGVCDCGASNCAYLNERTGMAFTGFVLAFEWMRSKYVMMLAKEPVPGLATEKVSIVRKD